MRVTNSVFVNRMLRDLNKNMDKLSGLQEQLATNKRINRPSDDPVGLVDTMRLRTGLNELTKYKGNAEDANSWLDASDSALGDVDSIMQRVRELAVTAANGELTTTEFDAVKKEVKQLKDQLIQTGNSTYAGRYLFSGTQTQTAAFDTDGTYQGNNGVIEYEVGAGVRLPINVDGATAFGNVFGAITKLSDNLDAGNISNISNQDLANLDQAMNNVNEVRADLGARSNRTDLITNRSDELEVNMTDLLSKVEDADIAEVTMQMKVQETIYQYSLQVGAKIIQPSLVDFMR